LFFRLSFFFFSCIVHCVVFLYVLLQVKFIERGCSLFHGTVKILDFSRDRSIETWVETEHLDLIKYFTIIIMHLMKSTLILIGLSHKKKLNLFFSSHLTTVVARLSQCSF
jgi:hypothetical protein